MTSEVWISVQRFIKQHTLVICVIVIVGIVPILAAAGFAISAAVINTDFEEGPYPYELVYSDLSGDQSIYVIHIEGRKRASLRRLAETVLEIAGEDDWVRIEGEYHRNGVSEFRYVRSPGGYDRSHRLRFGSDGLVTFDQDNNIVEILVDD